MDLDPELRSGVIKIRDCLRKYAASKSWAPESFRILVNVNATWATVTVIFFSEAFQGPDFREMEIYDEVTDLFEIELKDIPGLYEATYLLLQPLDKYPTWGYRDPPDNLIEIDESFLNPGIKIEDLRSPIASRM
jgi:hypothetical protein